MENPFSLEGKMALITGGTRGIGNAVARAFVSAGARVIITGRNEAAAREAAAGLGAFAIGKACDNGDPAQIAALIEECWQLGPIDILVNNAAISTFYRRAEFVTPDEWDSVLDVNLRGAYFTSIEVAKRLFAENRPGSIVNVSSMGGQVPLERLAVYCAAKAGLDHLTRVLALEWADRGVRVNAIAPGWTETDFTGDLFESRHGQALREDIPMGRVAAPEDITGAALFLASDASSYMTGSVVLIDGGRALR